MYKLCFLLVAIFMFIAVIMTTLNCGYWLGCTLTLIVVDSFEYLQEIVDAKEDEYRFDLEDLLNEFKKMAKELKVPVVLLMNMPLS